MEWNLGRCEDLVRKAAADTAPDLIVLPEAVTSPNVYHPSLRSAPTPVDGPAYQLFRGLAQELGCAVGAGYHSIRGDDAHHTYVLAEPDGDTHLHDKDQPSVWENCYYVGGTDDGVMATSFGPIGWRWASRPTAAAPPPASGPVGCGSSSAGSASRPIRAGRS